MLVNYTHLEMTGLLDRPAINLSSCLRQCYFTITKFLSSLVRRITGLIVVKDRIFDLHTLNNQILTSQSKSR